MELSRIYIYRITHIENIPHILQCGITHIKSSNANPNYISIGDLSLITTRATKAISINNGDSSKKYETITLGNFIPFYFGVRMPMLYVMQHGGNYVEKATLAQDIVYVVCKLIDFVNSKIVFYFSDGHATDFLSNFYDSSKVLDLPNIIDWDAIKSVYWGGEENLETKWKKQAEFLVGSDIPASFLFGFVCYNELAKQKLIGMNIDSERIKICPQHYY
jgi:hypothetical protein